MINRIDGYMDAELKQTKEENRKLKEELLRLEINKRKLNLKFSNIIDKPGENAAECERQVIKMLHVCGLPLNPMSITKAYRIRISTTKKSIIQWNLPFSLNV